MGGLQELITRFGARVYFVNFLKAKKAVTYKLIDSYIIMINESLNEQAVAEAVEHELWHIILGHLDDRKEMSEKDKEIEVKLNTKK